MPGPLGTLGPTVDPNWAWNTPGWNSQVNTGDTEGQNLGAPGQGSILVEPAALSGYIARTLDPDVSASGASSLTLTLGTAFLFGMQVLEPVSTTGIVVGGKTAGSSLHAVIGLYNAVTGTPVANTADVTTFGTAAAKIPWTAVTAISPGYYWALLVESGGTAGTLNAITLTGAGVGEAQVLLTGTHPVPFVTGTTPRFATGGTGLTGLTATPAGLVTLGSLLATNVISATATASFVGLY